ncbi:hypothetical protein ACWKWU_12040 [Chitinophaga lutea]
MKRLMLTLTVAGMGLWSASASAQNGVYLTAADFAKGKTTYEDANAYIPFRYGKVKAKDNGKTILLDKDEVYGYRRDGKDYRLVGNNAYRVLDAEHFPLYAREVETSKGKGRIRETQYFFSPSSNGDMQPLTIANLKKAFPDNQRFHRLLDLQFRHDSELAWYDASAKSYKLKSIFDQEI